MACSSGIASVIYSFNHNAPGQAAQLTDSTKRPEVIYTQM
jgi:hypothetical protein